jgi:hypothetical protein
MIAVGVGLVADLHRRQVGAERAVGCRHLPRGRLRFVVGESHREEYLPVAALGQHTERAHV